MGTMQQESTEYVYVGVSGDPPSVTQEIAFIDSPETRPTTEWVTAILVDTDAHALWDDAVASGATGDYFVTVLVGPFDSNPVDPGEGDYTVWLRLTDDDERPVLIAPMTLEIQ